MTIAFNRESNVRGTTMKRRLTSKLLLASLALAPLAGLPTTTATAQSVVRPAQDIVLSIGRGELVTVPGSMTDVFIANDKIADVQVKSRNQLYVFGKSGGVTTVYASNAAGDVIWAANIRVGSNIDSIDQMLALAMPEAKVNVATMGTNTVLLTGTVAAPEDAAEAERLVQAFTGEGMNVISRLKMATPLQVNLQVKFAEVSRTLVRALGANLATVDTTGGFKFGITNGRAAIPQYTPGSPGGLGVGFSSAPSGASRVAGNGQGSTLGLFGSLLGLDIASAFDLAETQGLVSTLSQPNLTALSGETADFLAGGEFPIPQSGGLGTTTVQYKKYGVSLSYTPTVLANGRISMRVRPEVSELTSQGAVQVDGFTIPALTVRRAETTIELGSGQSFMIAGLLSNASNNAIEKAPGLGDIPILGNLFRSTEFRKGETELVIVVTPYLVTPADANDIRLPTDGYRAPNVAQQVLGYFDNDGVSGGGRPVPTARDNGGAAPAISYAPPSGVPDENRPAQAAADVKTRPEQAGDAAKPGFSLN